MRRLWVLLTPLLLSGCGGHTDGSTGTTSIPDAGGTPDPSLEEPASSAPVGDPVAVTAPAPPATEQPMNTVGDHDAGVTVFLRDASVPEPDVSAYAPSGADASESTPPVLGSRCSCAPSDLMCHMRCAAESKDPPIDSGDQISDGGTPARDAAHLCNCAPSDLMCAMRCRIENAPSDASDACNCAPSDLMCAMRCAVNRDR